MIVGDAMTPLERLRAIQAGLPYDRIPCNPSLGDHAARVTGITVAEYHTSAKAMAHAQIAAYRRYGHDAVSVGPGSTGIAEAIGSRVAFPKESTPQITDHVVKDPADLERLAPTDPRKSGRFPVFLEALEILLEELGEEVPVSIIVGGPASTAANIRGTENLMRDFYENPQLAHDLLRFSLANTLPFISEAARLGARVGIVDPVASGSLISPRQFREFVFPYEKQLMDHIRSHGLAPTLHICGNTRKLWRDMADTGAAVLSLDNVIDLADAKAAVGDRVVLAGNINPTETMFRGAPRDVYANARECLKKGYDNPKGFILAMGCGLPINTPPENIHALMDAARTMGRYPLNPENFH